MLIPGFDCDSNEFIIWARLFYGWTPPPKKKERQKTEKNDTLFPYGFPLKPTKEGFPWAFVGFEQVTQVSHETDSTREPGLDHSGFSIPRGCGGQK